MSKCANCGQDKYSHPVSPELQCPEFRPMPGKITRDRFMEATGHEPYLDDLERCNCEKAGQIGHWSCGWNDEANKPQFVIGPRRNPPATNS